MNVTSKHAAIAVMITILFVLLFWSVKKWNDLDREKKQERSEHNLELSAWIVDWQWESGMEDFKKITEGLSSLQAFAVYFDNTDNLYLTDASRQALPKIIDASKQSSQVHVDLTVVNDRLDGDGSTVQKDPALITRLLATGESRNKHINSILDVVAKYDFDGVEIDYEKIDDGDWNNVCIFYSELYQRLHALGKSLRIVLEPRTPIEKIGLPEGPVYVMMAYNLYGSHSDPGPKADHAFISKLARRMDQVPGENFIAFSAGGFDWAEGGKVDAVTERQAVMLAQLSLDEPKRDAASGSIYFHYMDNTDTKHTVWYADNITLSQWIDVSQRAGYNKIALWRLGDLGEATLSHLNP